MGWYNGYGVLRDLAVPGCISEGSMHDYIPETYRLMNMEYKWLEAWHFFKSFCEYFEAGTIPTGNIAGTIHDSRNLNMMNYHKIKGSKDELLPLHKAKITVTPGDLEYTTDELYNGVYVFKMLEPGTYQVKAEAEGYHSQTQTIVVKQHETAYFNFMLNKIRNTPPEVINYSPKVSLDEPVMCASPVIFEFNWDVDVESAKNAFSISPQTEGEITFEDSQHRMVFKPTKPFEVSTLYTVRLDKSLKHPADMHMIEDFEFQFKTGDRNRLVMLANYPKADDQGVYYVAPLFEFWFDTELDGKFIRDGIHVYDSQGNELGKNARSVLTNKLPKPYGSNSFTLGSNLTPGETYKVVLNRNVIDTAGIDIVEPIEYTFKAVDVKVADKSIVETFEATTGLLNYNAAAGRKVKSASVSRSTSAKLFGSSSYAFNYVMEEAKEGEAVYEFVEPKNIAVNGKAIGVHLYGDLTGNELYLQFKSGDEVAYVKLADLNFRGWEFVECAVALTQGKEYALTGFKLVQRDFELSTSGTFYIDNLLVYDTLISSVEGAQRDGKVFAYPNPATDRLSVGGIEESELVRLELYTLSGVLMSYSFGNELSVAAVPAGTYLLKVLIKGETHLLPVMVIGKK